MKLTDILHVDQVKDRNYEAFVLMAFLPRTSE